MIIPNSERVTGRSQPADPAKIPDDWRTYVPDYATLLEEANGITIDHGIFRVFGAGQSTLSRDALAWNNEAWRARYRLSHNIVLWAENVFGDQYGVDRNNGALVLLNCEGGLLERLPYKTIKLCLEHIVLGPPSEWIEVDLVRAAYERGLRASLTEHLSFVLPLICGGKADVENLEVMDGAAHLDVLGQIVEQSRGLPNGTPIGRFRT